MLHETRDLQLDVVKRLKPTVLLKCAIFIFALVSGLEHQRR